MTVRELIISLLDENLDEEIKVNLTIFDKEGHRKPNLNFEIDRDSVFHDGMGNTVIAIYADEDEDFN